MFLKEMLVIKGAKLAFHHLIAKISGPIVFCDPAGVFQNEAKVPAFPSYLLPGANQPRRDSGNRLLTCPARGPCMQVDASSKIEAALQRSGDLGLELQVNHSSIRLTSA